MSIFVSYSRLDEMVVKELARGLEAADREVWFDNDLSGGEIWWVKILESIRQADVVMFGLSDHALRSKPCRAELDYAMALNRAILPIKVGPVANFRANPLAAIQTLEFDPARALTAFEIVGAVDDALRRTLPLPDDMPVEPQMPYAYLAQLSVQIDTDQLSPQVQIDAVDALRKAFREETDESVHTDILEILQRLKTKPWTTVETASEIETVFEWVERRTQGARARVPSSGERPQDGGGREASTEPSASPTRDAERPTTSGDTGTSNGSTSAEIKAEDTRRLQFEQRLAELMKSEQQEARVRREKHKRAAAASSASRAAPAGPGSVQPSGQPGAREEAATGGTGPTPRRAADPEEGRHRGTGAPPPQPSEPGGGGWFGGATETPEAPRSFALKDPVLRPLRTGASSSGNGSAAGPSAQLASPAAGASWSGVSTTAVRPPSAGGSSTPSPAASGSRPPRANWAWGIVTLPTVLFGILALYWAAQVNPRLTRGDLAGAQRASTYTRGWGIAGLVVLVVAVLWLLR